MGDEGKVEMLCLHAQVPIHRIFRRDPIFLHPAFIKNAEEFSVCRQTHGVTAMFSTSLERESFYLSGIDQNTLWAWSKIRSALFGPVDFEGRIPA